MTQDKVFLDGEGDAWYRRNRENQPPQADDFVMIEAYRLIDAEDKRRAIVEFGCSDGWRLRRLLFLYPERLRCTGLDPSRDAIRAGECSHKALSPLAPEDHLRLSCSTIEQKVSDSDAYFDIAICAFVLHWVDRKHLATAISNIDWTIRPGGHLILSDFWEDRPVRRRYHHREDQEVWTYHQDYAQCFLELGTYIRSARHKWSTEDNYNSQCDCSVLRKNPQAATIIE